MQVKIVIGTIAFMLTMIIFGYATLREPARMEAWTAAAEGRGIEQGADLFHNNCATCHGEHGRAEECYDGATGEQIACAGLALNRRELVCLDPENNNQSERMSALSWEGTLETYIASTVAAGRSANGMPTWGAEYGGPLENYQIDYLTNFIVNWSVGPLCEGPPPTIAPWPATVAELPEGDPINGEQLYTITYGCSACHGLIDEPGSEGVGPWSGELRDVADTRVEGYTVADYVYESILLPSAYIVPECPNGPCTGPPSAMPDNFGRRMSFQDMADVMAYLLSTTTFEGDTVITYP